MSFIKEKSEFNIDAAEELIKTCNYAPSVHCSYYASFQFIKFTLRKCRKITYEQIEKESFSSKRGSHNYLIDAALSAFEHEGFDKRERAGLRRKFIDLKTFRMKSDYHNVQIFSTDAEKSLSFSKEIIRTIKTKLK